MIKCKFKDGDVTLSLKYPCANLRMTTKGIAVLNTWVCSGNQHVTFDPNDMGPIANSARSQVLAASFREYGEGKTRVSISLACNGLMAMVFLNIGKPLPPPLILNLVPSHTQIELDKSLGVLISMQATRTLQNSSLSMHSERAM